MPEQKPKTMKPGVCIPWEDKRQEYPVILGDEKIVKKVWEDNDTLAYLYIWFCLIQF